MRDKLETKSKLVSSVGELIGKKGFNAVGVNAIARTAGVDKVLIYRYFDGLEGLYKAYAASADFWPSVEEILGTQEQQAELQSLPGSKALTLVFRRYAQALRTRPTTIEILAWETVERNGLTEALEHVREEMGLKMAESMRQLNLPNADWPSIVNMMVFAIHYAAVRARKIRHFNGIDIQADEAWERMFLSFERMIAAMEVLDD